LSNKCQTNRVTILKNTLTNTYKENIEKRNTGPELCKYEKYSSYEAYTIEKNGAS
jgi:hypothetical protein